MSRYLILDAFVDEPACFGVPPFLSPYPRYVAGALVLAGVEPDSIMYKTIDYLRERELLLDEGFEQVIIIGGAVVPGRYLGEKIGTRREIEELVDANPGQSFILGGPVSAVIPERENLLVAPGDPEAFVHDFIRGRPPRQHRTAEEISKWSVAGAWIAEQHPSWPHIICEMETYRGCPRERHCTFCSEGLLEKRESRKMEDVLEEIDALASHGVSRFRLGRQPDILQYGTTFRKYREGFPEPNPSFMKEFLRELRTRQSDKKIKTLCVDNANPGTVAAFPDESRDILSALAMTVTPGDTLALGIESFDPEVIRQNNLKTMPGESLRVIEIMNETGGGRQDGLPRLLPGINLLHGLRDETMETFRKNYESLKEVRDRGLLLRRINIRQVLPFPGTPLYRQPVNVSKKMRNRFEYYREMIRDDIDTVMLERIFPAGTLLRDCMAVENRAGWTYARQITSYAITLKIPADIEKGEPFDAIIVDHRERSLVALPFPVEINRLGETALWSIPGIGKRTARELVLKRPLSGPGEMGESWWRIPETIRECIQFT